MCDRPTPHGAAALPQTLSPTCTPKTPHGHAPLSPQAQQTKAPHRPQTDRSVTHARADLFFIQSLAPNSNGPNDRKYPSVVRASRTTRAQAADGSNVSYFFKTETRPEVSTGMLPKPAQPHSPPSQPIIGSSTPAHRVAACTSYMQLQIVTSYPGLVILL